MSDETTHLTPAELLHLLWIAAHVPGAGQALAHLLERCDGCTTPGTVWEEVAGELTEAHFDDGSLGGVAWAVLFYGHPGLTQALAHLLARCPECWRLAEGLFRQRRPAEESPDYKQLGRRLRRYVDDRRHGVERARRDAPDLLLRLLGQPEERRVLLLRNSARYHHPPLVEALCEESRRRAATSPEEAHDLATLAVEAASRLDPLIYGERLPFDLEALAYAHAGNALRVASRMREAGAQFARAEERLTLGSGLEGVAAEIEVLKASWVMAQGKTDEARRLLYRAAAVFGELGEDHRRARTLVKHAFICREAGEPEEACRLLVEVEPLLDLEREPRLALCAEHNRLLALVDLGRFPEALARFAGVSKLAQEVGGDLDLLRLRGVEGKIHAGSGRLLLAEVTLSQVREEFLALGLAVDAGLVSFEVCLVLLRLGRTEEVGRIVEEIRATFLDQGVAGEPLAACTVLAEAAAAQALTETLVLQSLERLRLVKRLGHP